jgi:hypothetical protein
MCGLVSILTSRQKKNILVTGARGNILLRSKMMRTSSQMDVALETYHSFLLEVPSNSQSLTC